MKIDCRHCGRYLMTATTTTIAEGVVCGNSKCKAKVNIKVLFSDDVTEAQLRHKFTTIEISPKSQTAIIKGEQI